MSECSACHQVFPHREDCPLILCKHGVTFDHELAVDERLTEEEVAQRWPRLDGQCPLGCGFYGIYYASIDHFVWGGWSEKLSEIPDDLSEVTD